jgi:sterol desaturase/sphingolipid hydroxylase (fatty acid hydroxylase superfamily)
MVQFLQGILHLFGYLAMVYTGLFLLERLAPVERHQPIKNTLFNIAITPALVILSALLVMWLGPLIQPATSDPIGQRIKLHFPDGVTGSVLALMTLMFASDFIYYWWHRFQHTNRWLWAQHTLHHSERSLSVLTSMRHHWLEDPIRLFTQALPLGFVLFVAPPSVAWVGSILALWPFFIHLNLRLPMGPFTVVFAGPQYHRIHHSILPQHLDKNFAAFFPLWDIIFGTACIPAKGEYPPTGIVGVETDSYAKALFSPFMDWARMARGLPILRNTSNTPPHA